MGDKLNPIFGQRLGEGISENPLPDITHTHTKKKESFSLSFSIFFYFFLVQIMKWTTIRRTLKKSDQRAVALSIGEELKNCFRTQSWGPERVKL
jgi:hypothetical protein